MAEEGKINLGRVSLKYNCDVKPGLSISQFD